MTMVVKNGNEPMKPVPITFEEVEMLSRNYKERKVINHPQETENPLEYILKNPVEIEDELIDIIKG